MALSVRSTNALSARRAGTTTVPVRSQMPVGATPSCSRAHNAFTSNSAARHQLHFAAPMRHMTHAAGRRAVVFATASDSVVVQLHVEGMMCGGCTSRIEEVIGKMSGIKSVSVDLEKKLANIEVNAASQADAAAAIPTLVQAITELGFEAKASS